MDEDHAFSALFSDHRPIADDGFTSRVLALAALEQRLAIRRRSAVRRLGIEATALACVLAAFAGLARIGPPSAEVEIGSPAMTGLLVLAIWLALGLRNPVRA